MVSADAVEQTPEVASGYDTHYLRGIARLGERLVILLGLGGLFGDVDAAALAAAAGRDADPPGHHLELSVRGPGEARGWLPGNS